MLRDKIKVLMMDVDGTMTDGTLYYSNDGEKDVLKGFSARDGYGIKNLLIPAGITPVILTARESGIVAHRAADLGVTHLYQSVRDKTEIVKRVMDEFGIEKEAIAYIGDDTNDLPAMEMSGLTFTPADGITAVQDYVDVVLRSKGGYGAVRECIDYILSH
jgi:3-deoxy-D-manno-octulosonate 8-phosphate phosphatase (KDO 8-P phosphatase)